MRPPLTDVNTPLHLFSPSLTSPAWTSRQPLPLPAAKPPSPANLGCPALPSRGGSRQANCLLCGSGSGRLWKPCPRRLQPILRLPPYLPLPPITNRFNRVLRAPRNDKPSVKEGLTRAGGWPYPRDAGRGKGKINRGKRFVKCPPPTLGTSGRGNYAQTVLKPTPG